MDAAAAVLTARNVSIGRGRRRLLEGVDLTLHRGEIVVVIGPNGVGKSTLIEVLAGLREPQAGTIDRAGRVAAALQAPALAQRSVLGNLDLAMGWWGVDRAQRTQRAQRALALLRIEHLADRPADALSGGEARRVHLARALVLGSDALLLDEPFAGLDPPTRAELLGDASTALRDPDRATLVVVHDRGEAWALADRLVVLLDGRVAAEGPPGAVLERPEDPDVARFLGFTGQLRDPGRGVLLLRPAQVTIDADGDRHGVVTRRIPEEDAVLCEVELDGGRVQVRAPYPGPEIGARVTVRLAGGVRFEEGLPSAT